MTVTTRSPASGGSTSVEYRGKVREHDPEGSWEGASRQSDDRIGHVQRGILAVLATRSCTDEQMMTAYRELAKSDPTLPMASDSGLRTRRHELHTRGAVFPSGRRATSTGTMAAVWSARPKEEAAELDLGGFL